MHLQAMACGLAVLALAPSASAQETYAQARALSLFNQLIEGATCEAALPQAREFWRSIVFRNQLVVEDQANFLGAVIQCALSLEDTREAINAANAAHDLGASWADKARLELALSLEDYGLAVEAFFDLARNVPKEFESLESYNAWGALRAAERIEGGESTMLRMHDALRAANYTPREGYHDDFFRLDHARLLLARGRVNDARERVEGVVDPWAIMTLRINRVYDPLRTDRAFERRLDIATAADAAIARARRVITDHPRQIGPLLQLAALLRYIGRSGDALALVEPALARAQSPATAREFEDLDTQLNWLIFAKADLLYDLGRNAEARTIYSEAMSTAGVGSGNITMTFAGMLNAEGRGADALQVLEMLPPLTTAYADVWRQSERACAAHLTGNTAVRDEALAAVRQNETHNMPSATHALLCVGDVDGAAAVMIRRLNNPIEREAALVALQPFNRIETRQMPAEVVELQRVAQLRDRADVRAALDAVGRIEPTPIYAY
jgi:tetratricopeptide (TPR) repeat protein